jgi:CDGSH-type Zn-finger protein
MAKDDRSMADPLTKITPYRDGPYLVRGPFALVDQEGNEIEVRRKVIALCRCGRSKTRPFCDGTHKATRFQAESGAANGAAGGSPASSRER